jgi:hypothetical protein
MSGRTPELEKPDDIHRLPTDPTDLTLCCLWKPSGRMAALEKCRHYQSKNVRPHTKASGSSISVEIRVSASNVFADDRRNSGSRTRISTPS